MCITVDTFLKYYLYAKLPLTWRCMECTKQVEIGISSWTVYLMPWSIETRWKPPQTNFRTAQMGFWGVWKGLWIVSHHWFQGKGWRLCIREHIHSMKNRMANTVPKIILIIFVILSWAFSSPGGKVFKWLETLQSFKDFHSVWNLSWSSTPLWFFSVCNGHSAL